MKQRTHTKRPAPSTQSSTTTRRKPLVGTRTRPFTTSAGVKLLLQGIPPMLIESVPDLIREEWAAAGKALPVRPTYIAQTAGGGEEVNEHDESTLETDEERAVWAAYIKLNAKFQSEVDKRTLRALLAETLVEAQEITGWEARQRVAGFKIPTDPLERMVHYVTTVAIRNADDAMGITQIALALTGVDEGVLADARKSFRGQVEGATRAKAGRVTNS